MLLPFRWSAYLRNGEGGCGQKPGDPNSSPCNSIGIHDAKSWYDNFISGQTFLPCGFNVQANAYGAEGSAKENFRQGLLASDFLRRDFLANPEVELGLAFNTLVIRAWMRDAPQQLPIEAFYYSNAKGLDSAQKNQLQFFYATKKLIPIVRVVQPRDLASGKYDFIYNRDDQNIPFDYPKN